MGKEATTREAGTSPARIHPDLFTAAEALEYLHRPCADPAKPTKEELAILASLRDNHDLIAFCGIGRELMYHRVHLDALVLRLAGMDQAEARAGRPSR